MSADIGRIQVGQPPAPVKAGPAQPVAAPPVAPIPPPVVIPPPASGGKGRLVLFGILGILGIVILAILVSALMGGNGEQVAEDTPTPSASATVSPRAKTLTSYFGTPKSTLTLGNAAAAASDFRNALLTAQPAAKQALAMEIRGAGGPMSADAFMKAVFASVPADVTAALAADWTAFAYGQTEIFGTDGTALANPPLATRPVLVFEIADASKANQAMQAWEGTDFASAAAAALGYDTAKALVETFGSGTYRQIPVRYRNFPYADLSADWAVMLASNGKNYLIISASRESMFFAVDQLMQ